MWQMCVASWSVASAGALLVWLAGGSDPIGMAFFFAAQIAGCVVLFKLDRRDQPMAELTALLIAGANLVVTLGRWRWELVAAGAVATTIFVLLSVHRLPGQPPVTMDRAVTPMWWATIGVIVFAILAIPLGYIDPTLDCIVWCE